MDLSKSFDYYSKKIAVVAAFATEAAFETRPHPLPNFFDKPNKLFFPFSCRFEINAFEGKKIQKKIIIKSI